jgi:hypothetical protein
MASDISGQRDFVGEERSIAAWLRSEFGCDEVEVSRMRRWRPILFADVTREGRREKLFLKGERSWPTHPYPLEYERDMQRTLSENGIRVPEVLGWIPSPKTIIMEWVEGGRDAGLMQEAIESGSQISDDRWQASLRYMDILAELHRIPIERFAAAGAEMPADNAQLMLGNFERFHAMSDALSLSDPFIHFVSRWLRRNVPQNRAGAAFLTGDCGQFLSDGAEITCLMDFEIGHIGDPMRDLACYRGRHPIEDMGDLPALFRRYEAASGQPLDWSAMAFHTVAFLAEAYYGPFFGLADRGPGGDWVESFVQVAVIGRRCLEALAEIDGIALEPVTLPAAEPTPLEDLALERLELDIQRLNEQPHFSEWQRGILASLPRLLRQIGHYRRWLEDEYRSDVASLVAAPVANGEQADAALCTFIDSAGPSEDEAITRLLHRKLLRQCLVIAKENPGAERIALAPMEPILQFAAAQVGNKVTEIGGNVDQYREEATHG